MGKNISNTQIIQQQYYGYCNTPNLWFDNTVFGLNQFDDPYHPDTQFTNYIALPQRLGKRVEHFVFQDLQQHPNIKLLATNLQIQKNKHTIGELDALLHVFNKPIHLEIIYKFYLYDPHVGSTALDYWIGPNRRDALVKKLDKLKNQQLPLLHKPETLSYLNDLSLHAQDIEQQVLFKAQLFMPFHAKITDIEPLNQDCIQGFYYKFNELPSLHNCQFYIPPKLDWLSQAQYNVTWLEYKTLTKSLKAFLSNKQSPLVWIKRPDNTLERCFMVWW